MILEILVILASILIFVCLVIFGWGIGKFNTFKVAIQDIKNQWSNIKTEYQRRADLFYNLAQVVKSHKEFEKSTLVDVIAARSGNFGIGKASEMSKLKGLDKTFNKLMLLTEAYPDLKSHEQHNKLLDEIRITEDRVNVARTDYNAIVGDYNKVVTTFPSNVIAGLFRFKEEVFFENEPETNKSPKIYLE